MDRIAASLKVANPVWNKDDLAGVRPLRDHIVGARTKSWMLMLLGAVAIVLVIACANVANLLLARASTREREVGIRAALGAGRWRLIRQLMVESLVLSFVGTLIATALAWWAIQILRNSMPDGVPRVATIALDLRVLGAAAGLSLLTGLLFGVVPALQLSKPGSDGRPQGGRARRQHRRGATTAAQHPGGRRGRARGRAARRRVALHRQLRHADAHRPGLRSTQRPHRADLAAIRAWLTRRRPGGAVRADRRACQPRAWRHARVDDFGRHAARRQHEHHDADGTRRQEAGQR